MLRFQQCLRYILLATTFLCTPLVLANEAWPQRPLKIIVPYSPGASTDNVARRMAQELGKRLDQTVVVENKMGAMGTIGMSEAARANPDGYTLAAIDTGFVMLPLLRKSMPYRSEDFIPIGAFVFSPFGLVVNSSSSYETLQDLIDKAKENPETISFGSGGIGTSPHLATEQFASQAGIKLFHVPFKGASDAMLGLFSNTTDMQLGTPSTMLGNINGGKLRMLAISGDQRQPLLPNVPTFAEAGLKDYGVWNWIGLWAPKGTPTEIVQRLRQEVLAIMRTPEMKAFAESMAAEPKVVVGDEFAKMLKDETRMWQEVVDRIGLNPQ